MTEWDRNWLAGYIGATQTYVTESQDNRYQSNRDLRCKAGAIGTLYMANLTDSEWERGWSDACLDAFGC